MVRMMNSKGSDRMANEEAKKTDKKRHLTKKQSVLYSYIGILAVLTILFGYSVLNYFYFEPLKAAGQPIYGYRTENLDSISDAIIEKAKQVGVNQTGVENVNITVQGPVIYFDVRVNTGVKLETAQAAAEATVNEFLSQAGEIANQYTLQLVVSTGDIDDLKATNREEELAYVKEHDVAIVELIVADAEKYPTAAKINRAQQNIDLMKKSYPEEADAFQARINELTELTAEQEEALGEVPVLEVDQTIQQSDISNYPSWGAYDKETQTFEWQ